MHCPHCQAKLCLRVCARVVWDYDHFPQLPSPHQASPLQRLVDGVCMAVVGWRGQFPSSFGQRAPCVMGSVCDKTSRRHWIFCIFSKAICRSISPRHATARRCAKNVPWLQSLSGGLLWYEAGDEWWNILGWQHGCWRYDENRRDMLTTGWCPIPETRRTDLPLHSHATQVVVDSLSHDPVLGNYLVVRRRHGVWDRGRSSLHDLWFVADLKEGWRFWVSS